MSEPVVDITVTAIAGLTPSITHITGPAKPIIKDQEFLIPLGSSSFDLSDLVDGLETFTISGAKDKASRALDLHKEDLIGNTRPYWYIFPSPKYPMNYNYELPYEIVPDEVYFPDPPGSPPLAPRYFVYPPNEIYDHSTGAIAVTEEHRVTDVLISVPPSATNSTQYFVWPVWARYADPSNANFPSDSADSFWGQDSTDTGLIWQFDGKKYIEERDSILQVRLNDSLASLLITPEIFYDYSVPQLYRTRGLDRIDRGLWLPQIMVTTPPYFTNAVPYFWPTPRSKSAGAGPKLFQWTFSKDEPGYDSGSFLEFFFHLSASPADLYAARLDSSPGVVPPDWYRRVRPFGFEIHDITRQRSGVTILNNVINPNNGESTYVQYQLTKGGQVTIQVFTMDGTMVDILYRGYREAGDYRAAWNGKNRAGRAVARGMYFIRVVAPDIDEIRKVMVVK
jgi:hypothetical protein